MKLYIARHAWAGEHDPDRYPDDALRPLTKSGRSRYKRMARKLVKRGLELSLTATSPLVRCRQTAEILAERSGSRGPVELDSLAPNSDLHALVEWTNGQNCQSVAWVGHAPDVGRLTAALAGDSSAAIGLDKGAMACIEFQDEIQPGKGILVWLVTAELLKC